MAPRLRASWAAELHPEPLPHNSEGADGPVARPSQSAIRQAFDEAFGIEDVQFYDPQVRILGLAAIEISRELAGFLGIFRPRQ